MFVHDGQFQVGKDGSPNSEVAPGCFSSPNQLCEMCAYKITVRRCRILGNLANCSPTGFGLGVMHACWT